MSDEELSTGIWFAWLLASDAAHEAGAPTIEPAHLLIALCQLGNWEAAEGTDLDPAVAEELTHEAAQLSSRFARAGLDAVRLRRRIRKRLGGPASAGPASAGPPPENMLHRSPATRALFARAGALAEETTAQRVDALHLLRAVLESPEPGWAGPASELGVDDLLAACFPPAGPVDEPRAGTAQVRFEVCEGELSTRRFVFTERARWVIGRASDCNLRIPDDERNVISRHHCLIELNPPEARIRDLGSRNGTFVNDEQLGTPPTDRDSEVTRVASADRDLADGDLIKVGDLVLKVSIVAPRQASRTCPATLVAPSTLVLRRCRVCSEDIAPTPGAWAHDPELCAPCRHDPDRVMRLLADQIDGGTEKGGMFGSYTIIRRIGVGGMGAVYLARDEPTGELVALKIMLPQVPGADQAEQRFLREAANSKLLRHRYIVRQREHDRWHGIFYIAMDYCEGGNLIELMHRSDGRLPVGRAVRITLQALDALAYAHGVDVPVRLPGDRIKVDTGLVHRDISPGNLLFSGGMVKLADFGLSKAFDSAGLSGITRSGTAAGKPRFVPRQQVVNYRRATPAVDVWSVAACLYFMLTGLTPRDFDPCAMDDWSVVLGTSAVPIRERDHTIPPALARVIDHALVDDPDIGFPTAQQFRDALLRAHHC